MKNYLGITLKIGLLFSTIFIGLFLILASILYGVFTNLFVDYITQDLQVRGNNHARIVAESPNKETIGHVIEMEKGASTSVLITDVEQKVLASSETPDQDMDNHLVDKGSKQTARVLESDWRQHKYIITISPMKNNAGYVYMYYPSKILREIIYVMNVLFIVSGLGILLLAFGLIGLISQRLTKPLVIMKEATNKIALGKYKQVISVKGNDEIAQLGNSIQLLGEQLQYFENSRNEFLAEVSHELRTPLTYIKGYSDILAKGKVSNKEDQENYLNIINKEASRLTFLVNDLFEMSKIEVGKFELNKEVTMINELIEKVVSNLMPAARKKGLDIKTDYQADLPEISVDLERMEQVFYNLIENAIKYTIKGQITVRSYLKSDFVIIEIIDSGIGIPSEELPKIWERFYRVDQSRTRKTGGTGLGLYVVKQIIESHHGNIIGSSKEKEGSTFTIFLKL
ncbi:sensor histidine kinase [Paenisporosarcina sp. TG-14]|uniref:sensor histidine kinase n=1 Tax=Paenisporosarcina sp. TG-14 TaxID=1231057 RepID=UPI0002E6573F|nr:HAMP domain-containing sensor histidine kinase [Paenisporosarcina sp. TG-14]